MYKFVSDLYEHNTNCGIRNEMILFMLCISVLVSHAQTLMCSLSICSRKHSSEIADRWLKHFLEFVVSWEHSKDQTKLLQNLSLVPKVWDSGWFTIGMLCWTLHIINGIILCRYICYVCTYINHIQIHVFPHILVWNPKEKRPLERPRVCGRTKKERVLKFMECEGWDWINLA